MGDPSVPILVYHRVHADGDPAMPDVEPDRYCGHVTAGQFGQQMEYLAERGCHTITRDEIVVWLEEGEQPGPGSIAIDFDDNRYNVLENAFPVMRACGFVGAMFVVTDLAGGKEIGMNEFPALMWGDLALLLEAGWSIEAHTKTHVTFGSPGNPPLDEVQMIDEIVGAQAVIREQLGVPVNHFVYPTGTFDEASERLVKQTYRTARLWQEHPRPLPAPPYEYITESTNPYRLNGINISAKMSFDDFRAVIEGAEKGTGPT